MPKQLDEIQSELANTDADSSADWLLVRDVSADIDKKMHPGTAAGEDLTEQGGRVSTTGFSESVTLSSGVLTIPAGKSTIKLPSSVWDGTSNITISGFAFENGVQPEEGYEFALVIPRTEDEGDLSAGSLGNEVLLEHGTSLQVSANGFADLPCYPNAADNPDADAVQFAAPYYRLKMRVEEYDGDGDPVVSVEELPGAARGSNDRGAWVRWPNGLSDCRVRRFKLPLDNADRGFFGRKDWVMPAPFSGSENSSVAGGPDNQASLASFSFDNVQGGITSNGVQSGGEIVEQVGTSVRDEIASSGDEMSVSVSARGEWHQ